MSNWGGTDAACLKKAIDDIFSEKGCLPMKEYATKLVAATADGASVNMGRISGLMTRLGENRDWLVKIHCINHCVELAVKDAFKDSKFKEIDDFYQANHSLLKASGKIKNEVENAATALGIQAYALTKLKGTRFIGHRFGAYTRLLDMWPAFDTAYENVVSDKRTKEETKAKVRGLLSKFRNYRFLAYTCCYLDLLEKAKPSSKVFEGVGLLPFEIWPCAQQTIDELSELITESVEEGLDSNLRRYRIATDDSGDTTVTCEFTRKGDNLQKENCRSPVTITMREMKNVRQAVKEEALRQRSVTGEKLIEAMEERLETYDDGVFSTMKWFDPKQWKDDKDYGIPEITAFAEIFETPLRKTNFDLSKAIKEWKSFKKYVQYHAYGIEARKLWQNMLCYRADEYPNLCILAQIMIAISGSNSSVERAFSILRMLLSDRRLRMSHSAMEMRLRIAINDNIWTEGERADILERATELYLSKSRKRKLDDENDTSKKPRLEKEDEDEETSDEEESDDDYTFFE